ncbi:MAG: hypothetical protein DRP64_18430 [Verrucomicrobia bacterium]|nr:MAG: hypothetical protein DRP64_18430 [Verrucomicrobiota bacterium]
MHGATLTLLILLLGIHTANAQGVLTNGANHFGTINVGDTNLWNFAAVEGESVLVRLGELSDVGGLNLLISVSAPDGSFIIQDSHALDPRVSFVTSTNGTYTVKVGSWFSGGSGTYRLESNGLSGGLKACVPEILGVDYALVAIGGAPGATNVLWSTTNLVEAASWKPVSTNQFDSSGVMGHTNAFNPTDPQRFFRIEQQ